MKDRREKSDRAWSPCTHLGHGVRVALDWDYHRLAHVADKTIAELTAAHPRPAALYSRLLNDPQALALWDLTGYVAVERLGYNDHGQMHAQVVAANALQLLSLLHASSIEPHVVSSGAGTLEDVSVVVLAAALLHDVGNQVAREGHEAYSIMLARPLLARLLPDLYPDPAQAQVLIGFILGAIASHDCNPAPVTLEGRLVAVADGADMSRGRGQVAFDRGKADIHAISAMAVREVIIRAGEETPAHIEVRMDNPAGIFQVERLLARKLILSGLDRQVSLRACVVPGNNEEARSFHSLVLRQGRFQPEGLSRRSEEHWPLDPVCGMAVAPRQAAGSLVYRGTRYLLCSTACLARFRDNPSHYVQGES